MSGLKRHRRSLTARKRMYLLKSACDFSVSKIWFFNFFLTSFLQVIIGCLDATRNLTCWLMSAYSRRSIPPIEKWWWFKKAYKIYINNNSFETLFHHHHSFKVLSFSSILRYLSFVYSELSALAAFAAALAAFLSSSAFWTSPAMPKAFCKTSGAYCGVPLCFSMSLQ